jgi:tetratricopeptide (TPR) repeat protein
MRRRLVRFEYAIRQLRSIITDLAVIVGVGFVAVLLWCIVFKESQPTIVLQNCFLSHDIEQQGYNLQIILEKLRDRITAIGNAEKNIELVDAPLPISGNQDVPAPLAPQSFRIPITISEEAPDVEIPETQTTLQAVLHVIRYYTGSEGKDVDCSLLSTADHQFNLTVRILDQGTSQSQTFSAATIDDAIDQGARYVELDQNPVAAVWYIYNRSPDQCGQILDALNGDGTKLEKCVWYHIIRGLLASRAQAKCDTESEFDRAKMLIEGPIDPYFNTYFVARAYGLEMIGDYDGALDCLNTKYKYDSDDEKGTALRAWVLRHRDKGNDIDNAITQLKLSLNSLDGATDQAIAYLQLGLCYSDAQPPQYDKAIEAYEDALAFDPKNSEVCDSWADTLLDLCRYHEAIGVCSRATQFNPKDGAAFYNWGCALFDLGRYCEAIEKFKTTVRLNPGTVAAYSAWADALIKMQNYARAVDICHQAFAIDQHDAYLYNVLGTALAYVCPSSPDVAAAFERAVELDPGHNYDTWYRWGIIPMKSKNYLSAIEKFEDVIKYNQPESSDSLNLLGRLAKSGDSATQLKAREQLKTASNSPYRAISAIARQILDRLPSTTAESRRH